MTNHPLEADYHHTLERLGLDPDGNHHAAAREHAREAGREAVADGGARTDVPGHIKPWPDLLHAYEHGLAEVEAKGIRNAASDRTEPPSGREKPRRL